MIYEFEGRTEKEAIDRAAAELGLEKDGFDVEILETQRSGLFKKGYVKIRVHTEEPVPGFRPAEKERPAPAEPVREERRPAENPATRDEVEKSIAGFI